MQKAFEKIVERLESIRGTFLGFTDDDFYFGKVTAYSDAIEIVKQVAEEYKSNDDLISRTEVLELIEDIKCDDSVPKNYGTLLDIMRQIRKMPTVQVNDGWIPCSSGKMPADYGEDWVQIQIKERHTGYLWIPRTGEYRNGAWWVAGFDEDVRVKPPFEVVAWQPLPQPYVKGE